MPQQVPQLDQTMDQHHQKQQHEQRMQQQSEKRQLLPRALADDLLMRRRVFVGNLNHAVSCAG